MAYRRTPGQRFAPALIILAVACSDDDGGGGPEDLSCGDQEVSGGEACDDGNLVGGDGCSSACAVEDGWSCMGSPSRCTFDCETPQACDDADVCTVDACDPDLGCIHEDTSATCDDQNECTTDSCHAVAGCQYSLIRSGECRPEIQVTYPARGATIQSNGEAVVVVTGSVYSGAGTVGWLVLNGEKVSLNEDGSFSHPVAVTVGGNTLVFRATDVVGAVRQRVQAFLWSSVYRRPSATGFEGGGVLPQGLGLWLSQAVLDDGDHAQPIDDIASGLEVALGSLDLSEVFPSLLAEDLDVPLLGTYDVYLEELQWGAPKVALTAMDGGLTLGLVIESIRGDIRARKTCSWGWPPWECTGAGTVNGDLKASSVEVTTDLLLAAGASGRPDVVPRDTRAVIRGLELSTEGALSPLVDLLIDQIVGDFESAIEAEMAEEIENEIGPALEDALGGLLPSQDFPIPNLGGGDGDSTATLETAYDSIDFTPSGGTLVYRTVAHATPVAPYENLGAPGRAGCGAGPQVLVVPDDSELGMGLADDMLGQLLYAAWMGGLLEVTVPPDAFDANLDLLDAIGVTNLQVTLSGMLAPTLSDCGTSGELELHVGDLRVDISMDLEGEPVDVVAFATLKLGVELRAEQGEILLVATGLRSSDIEVTVQQDELVALEDLIAGLIRGFLTGEQGLLSSSADQVLAALPLPALDMSFFDDVPPDTAISITPDSVARERGSTLIRAHAAGARD